jgi:hypothetical protein
MQKFASGNYIPLSMDIKIGKYKCEKMEVTNA